MKAGWEVKRLGEVCSFQRGLTYKKTDEVAHSRNRVLRANNINRDTGCLDFSDIKYIDDAVDIPISRKIRRDCLIICTASGSKSHLGKVALIDTDDDFAFGGFMGMLIPAEYVLPKFLYWYTRSTEYFEFIDALTDGANINNLRFNQLSKAPFPLPPLKEQKRIVAILDEAFEGLTRARANTETNLQNARNLFEEYLAQLFSDTSANWKARKLSSLCSRITVGFVGPMAHRYEVSGIPFLRSQNVRAFEVALDDVKFIGDDFQKEIKKSTLRPGDVAIVRTGYPGTAAVIPDTLPVSNCSDIVIATPTKELSAHFLAMFLNSDFGKRLVAEKSVGAAQKHFNVSAAKEVDFPTPPIEEQESLVQATAERRRDCLQVESFYRAKLADLDVLRQSLLQKAFAGELT